MVLEIYLRQFKARNALKLAVLKSFLLLLRLLQLEQQWKESDTTLKLLQLTVQSNFKANTGIQTLKVHQRNQVILFHQ